jgi:DNA-directed RNA polymerase beta subunit
MPNVAKAGIPESFNVLVKELKAVGLNVDLDNWRHEGS